MTKPCTSKAVDGKVLWQWATPESSFVHRIERWARLAPDRIDLSSNGRDDRYLSRKPVLQLLLPL